jgi:O-antigen ligase/polysaccharide polymerase Wzy-like membrane protein
VTGAGALAIFAVVLAVAAVVVWRRPVVALYLFVVGLAVHNAAMAALYGAGLHGRVLSIIILWKEALLGVALARVAYDSIRARRFPFRPIAVDWLALAFLGLLVVYALIPQSALGGSAGPKARVYAFHHDALAIGGYVLGRSLRLGRFHLQRLAVALVSTGAVMAVVGLIDDYAVPISWWRRSAVPDFFNKQLGYDYHGTGRLPENFVYNVGGDKPFLRRLVSLFLTPLGTSYVLVVALVVAAAFAFVWRRRFGLLLAAVVVMAAGLLWTFSRASVLALAAGLCVLAVLLRRAWPVGAAVVAVGVGIAFAHVFPSIGPTGRWTAADLAYQHQQARLHPTVNNSPTSANESSIHSHLVNLRDGLRTVGKHPQGYGLGNAGTIAVRLDVPIKAGESDYTELGVEAGLVGMLVFVAWGLALLWSVCRAALGARDAVVRAATAGIAAAFAAVLLLAIQTDIYGVPWVALSVWTLAAAAVSAVASDVPGVEPESARSRTPEADRAPLTAV